MSPQLLLWSPSDIDSLFPRIRTPEEIERASLERKLVKRAVLSEKDFEDYNFPLSKKDMVSYVKKANEEKSIFHPGISQMLLNSLSQYFDKPQEELVFSDLVIMYKSIANIFSGDKWGEINENVWEKQKILKKFRKANKMNFFGYGQYEFMGNYLKDF